MLEQVDMDELLEEHAEGLDDDDGSVLNTVAEFLHAGNLRK